MNYKNLLTFVFCFLAVLAYSQSYSDLDMNTFQTYKGDDREKNLRPIPATGADFYTDVTAFEGACSSAESLSLTTVSEDFQSTLIGVGGIGFCGATLNDVTDDACYSPGSVESGFELSVVSGGDLVVLGEDFLGAPHPAFVGPVSFADDMLLSFSNPINVGCIEYVEGVNPPGLPFQVELFGASGSLGVFDGVTNGITPVTICFIASEDVSSATIVDDGAGGLLSGLTFGTCEPIPVEPTTAIPTMGEWGLMSLGLIFMILGVISVRQREIVFNS